MSTSKRAANEEGDDSSAGGRSMRQREKRTYNDDNPLILAALAHMEDERKSRPQRTDDVAARELGLQPYELADFERTCCAIPDALRRKPSRMTSIRNHMLGRAAKNPSKFLTFAESVKGLDSSFQRSVATSADAADASAVYECLTHHGYLNFGVLDDHPCLPAAGRSTVSSSKAAAAATANPARRRVIVIGAGAAGLAAARQLHMLGHEVIVLEARQRTGGRVHTLNVKTPMGMGSVDLGAMVVTGTEGNPVAMIARQTRSRMHRLTPKCRIYTPTGQPVPDALDTALEAEWNTMLDMCKAEALPEPFADVSLGSRLRAILRERKEWYSTIEGQLAQDEAARRAHHDASGPRSAVLGGSSLVISEGEVAISAYACELCGRCFASIDRLDRHRLCCLPEGDATRVLVRSHKAFSGFEGVVVSQTGKGDKWEAFIIDSSYGSSYGRKRRRVGQIFDSATVIAG